jgi:hypothetical protein
MRDSGYERAANSWYVEPPWAVHALLEVEKFDGITHDPSCGAGNIPKVFRERGIYCTGSDIVDRGFGYVSNFLASNTSYTNIVCNPPFELTKEFIDHALWLGIGKVAILGRLAFLESQARREWWTQVPFARLWVSSRRISMPPGGTGVEAKGGTVAYGWFVFERTHEGPATIGWI